MRLIAVEKAIERALPPMHGWCSPEKGKRLAALSYGASLLVELGVFGGRSLVSMALACKDQGFGVVHGIDPFTAEAALEGTNGQANEDWWSKIDYEAILESARAAVSGLGLEPHVRLVRSRSSEVVDDYADGSIDVLHQDANHSEEMSCREVSLWHGKIRPGGYWISDDADWESTQRALGMLAALGFELLEDHGKWRIYGRPEASLAALAFCGQAGQDRFAYHVLGAPKKGTFLDLGSSDPIVNSNTYALEQAGWRGLLVDRQEALGPIVAGMRRSPFLCADARKVDWGATLREHGLGAGTIDYLSFDLDDDGAEVLAQLPLGEVRFRALTIEHDGYRLGDGVRQRMRELLQSRGYDLLCPDVTCQGLEFEDWWVDPSSVDMRAAERFRTTGAADWRDILARAGALP